MINTYIKMILIFLIIMGIIYLPILFILRKKGIRIVRQISYLSLFLSVFFIVFLTIILFNLPLSFKPDEYVISVIPFDRFNEENLNVFKTVITEIIPNIIMFIPLGLFIPIVFKKMRILYKTTLIAFFVTLSIETFQYFIGRKSDIDDILMNVLGGIIGYGLFRVLNHFFTDKKWWNRFIGEDLTL